MRTLIINTLNPVDVISGLYTSLRFYNPAKRITVISPVYVSQTISIFSIKKELARANRNGIYYILTSLALRVIKTHCPVQKLACDTSTDRQ